MQQVPSLQHSDDEGQQTGEPLFGGHPSPTPPGHCWQMPRTGSMHAEPAAQQLSPHVRLEPPLLSRGQQVDPLLVHEPAQHWPLQQLSNGGQQFDPHAWFGASQHTTPLRQLCEGQHAPLQRSSRVQHVWSVPQTCAPLQQVVPPPHSGPESAGQQRFVFGSAQ